MKQVEELYMTNNKMTFAVIKETDNTRSIELGLNLRDNLLRNTYNNVKINDSNKHEYDCQKYEFSNIRKDIIDILKENSAIINLEVRPGESRWEYEIINLERRNQTETTHNLIMALVQSEIDKTDKVATVFIEDDKFIIRTSKNIDYIREIVNKAVILWKNTNILK